MIELHGPVHARHTPAAALRLHRLIQQLEQALPRGDPLLQRAGHPHQLAQRLRDAHERGEEAQQVTHAHAAVDGIGDRDRQHERETHDGHQLHGRIRDSFGQNELHVRAQVAIVHGVELPAQMLLCVVDLDEPRGFEALLGDARDVAHRVLDAAAVAAELLVDDRHQPAHQRPHDERDERETHVEPQQKADRGDDGERGAHRDDHRVGGRLADLLGVVGEARQQRGGGAAIEVTDRQVQDVPEHLASQLAHDAAADVAHEVGLGEIAQAPQDEQADQRERHPHDGARVLVGEGAVAEFLGEQREARHGGGKQHSAEDPEYEAPPIRAQVAEQAPVGPQRAAPEGCSAPRCDTCAERVVQGLPAVSSLTVAILTSANPRRPSTSMAVMTDW